MVGGQRALHRQQGVLGVEHRLKVDKSGGILVSRQLERALAGSFGILQRPFSDAFVGIGNERILDFNARFGPVWEPAPLLATLAETNAKFSSYRKAK